ncbi:hypothetical protein ACFX15_012850 [Malus domestica]
MSLNCNTASNAPCLHELKLRTTPKAPRLHEPKLHEPKLLVCKSLNYKTPTLLACMSLNCNTASNAPCLHELKLRTTPKAPRLHKPKLHEPTFLVCTSIKGNTNAPCLQELKLQTTPTLLACMS